MFKGAVNAGRKIVTPDRVNPVLKAIGTPSMRAAVKGQTLTDAQLIARGRRRAIWGGGGLAVGLGANSLMAPRHSSGSQGLYPKSSGGYA
jgi:hypothetical protein